MIRKANVLIKQWALKEIMRCRQDHPNTQMPFMNFVTYIISLCEKERDIVQPAFLLGI